MDVTFQITEYADGKYKIETSHMHYHYVNGLSYDDVKPEYLAECMRKIANACNNKYNVGCLFVMG